MQRAENGSHLSTFKRRPLSGHSVSLEPNFTPLHVSSTQKSVYHPPPLKQLEPLYSISAKEKLKFTYFWKTEIVRHKLSVLSRFHTIAIVHTKNNKERSITPPADSQQCSSERIPFLSKQNRSQTKPFVYTAKSEIRYYTTLYSWVAKLIVLKCSYNPVYVQLVQYMCF